jgi:glycosyltransferase involved in cell wall biosynthesis
MCDIKSLSIVIPVYNESSILDDVIRGLLGEFRRSPWIFELIISENGSTDRSPRICDALAAEFPEVRVIHLPEANYGLALRQAYLAAGNEFLLNFSVDWIDLDFARRAIQIIGDADIVSGVKISDQRGWVRRFGSQGFKVLEHFLFKIPTADTHGLKLLRRSTCQPIIQAVRHGHEVFDTEMLARVGAARLKVVDVGLELREVRTARVPLLRRLLKAAWHMVRLKAAMTFEGIYRNRA